MLLQAMQWKLLYFLSIQSLKLVLKFVNSASGVHWSTNGVHYFC